MKKQEEKQRIFKEIIQICDLRLDHYRNNDQFWQFICLNFDLPEWFIREYQHMIDWSWVSRYQNLSDDLLREFKRKIDWDFYRHRLHGKQKKEFNFFK